MPEDQPRTTEELFDLFLLGFMFAQSKRAVTRTAPPILDALKQAGLLTDEQLKATPNNAALISLTMNVSQIEKLLELPRGAALDEFIRSSDKLLVIFADYEMFLQYPRFFGTVRGVRVYKPYQMVLTQKGMEHAASLAPKYAELLTPEQFNASSRKA